MCYYIIIYIYNIITQASTKILENINSTEKNRNQSFSQVYLIAAYGRIVCHRVKIFYFSFFFPGIFRGTVRILLQPISYNIIII